MEKVLHLTKDNFEQEALKGTVLVDFFASWCGPCQMLGPIIDRLPGKVAGVKIAKVSVETEEGLSLAYRVSSIPTLVLLVEGKEKARMSGFHSEEQIIKFINDNK